MGAAHHALGDAGRAGHDYRQALTLFRDLGVPEADEIRTALAAVE